MHFAPMINRLQRQADELSRYATDVGTGHDPSRIREVPSICPQNASRDGRNPCKNRTSARRAKSLLLRRLDDKVSIRKRMVNRVNSNPPLSDSMFAMPVSGSPVRPISSLQLNAAQAVESGAGVAARRAIPPAAARWQKASRARAASRIRSRQPRILIIPTPK